MSAYTVLTIVDDATHEPLSAALATIVPQAAVHRANPALIARLPVAEALVVSSPENARLARAAGFRGGIVVVATIPADDAACLAAQAIFVVQPDTLLGEMPELAAAMGRAIPLDETGGPRQIHDALFRTRRLLAAGELAFSLQHDFNNPLAALLAEAQLLEMEAATPELKAASGRILELVRRLTALTRALDGVRDRNPPA